MVVVDEPTEKFKTIYLTIESTRRGSFWFILGWLKMTLEDQSWDNSKRLWMENGRSGATLVHVQRLAFLELRVLD